MKDKTIRSICRGKLYAWANSVISKKQAEENPDKIESKVRNAILNDVFITGGAIVSMLMDEEINDFDVYFRTKESALLVANYYVERFTTENKSWVNTRVGNLHVADKGDRIAIVIESQGMAAADGVDESDVITDNTEPGPAIGVQTVPIEHDEDGASVSESQYRYFEGTNGDEASEFISDLATRKKNVKEYGPIFLTDNAITLENKVQIIIRFFGEPEEVHKNYDFVHCTSFYKGWDDELVIPYEALRAIQNKELRYVGSLYPICSVIRLRKFIKRGWTVSAGQILKMCYQISKLELDKIEVLRDQLVGVDSAYFNELISIMSTDVEGGKEIDQTYLANLIDQIFD